MSDRQLRTLERRWRESRDSQDEAALLKARVRAGELSEERLRFAFYLHYPAAELAFEEALVCTCGISRREGHPRTCPVSKAPGGASVLRRPKALLRWCRGLEMFGLESCARAAIASVRAAVPLEARAGFDHAMVLVEDWVLCPCAGHASAARVIEISSDWDRARELHLGLLFLTQVNWKKDEWVNSLAAAGTSVKQSIALTSKRTIVRALADEVVAWALGYRDPIRERADARRAGR